MFNIKYLREGSIKILKIQTMQIILSNIKLSKDYTKRQTMVLSTNILHHDDIELPFNQWFHHVYVTGNLNLLNNSNRRGIYYATNQCGHFYKDPKTFHGAGVEHSDNFLSSTMTDAVILDSNEDKSFMLHMNSKYSITWQHTTSDKENSMKNHVPVTWLYIMADQIFVSQFPEVPLVLQTQSILRLKKIYKI